MLVPLKEIAEQYGYSGELPAFLNDLQENLMVIGAGEYIVEDALKHRLPKYSIVKIALGNFGHFFDPDVGPAAINYREPTLEEWEKQGEEEFKKHLDKDGKFRFSDFQLRLEPEDE